MECAEQMEAAGVDSVVIGTDFNRGGGISGYAGAVDAPNVTAALVERGYSASETASIWGENFLRVFDAVR